MIGFYDYTVVLTYLGLLSSVFGMTRAIHGDYKIAIICLAISHGQRFVGTEQQAVLDIRTTTCQRHIDSRRVCRHFSFGSHNGNRQDILSIDGTHGEAMSTEG